jgi:23S rRNA (adenine1618-N6)-methyltransferase
MSSDSSASSKSRLHIRNKNRERYDLDALVASNPELAEYVKPNRYGADSVDFADPKAVKILNRALLNHYYGISHWDFPDENLCPAIPGRADYLHHMADLLCESNFGKIPKGDKITCLDVGVGASCIYPIIGVTEYGWNFIGSDIDPKSIESAKNIIESNDLLVSKVECRLQKERKDVFYGIIDKEDKIDISICNPPFHSSSEDAQKENLRKVKNLKGRKVKSPELNFAGIPDELICDGGEQKFILNMIKESKKFAKNFFWFSSLVSKQSHLKGIYSLLDSQGVYTYKTITTGTGNKSSRIVAWTFLSRTEQKEWKETRWRKKRIVENED